jgi:hypothetical protein
LLSACSNVSTLSESVDSTPDKEQIIDSTVSEVLIEVIDSVEEEVLTAVLISYR